MPIAVTPSRIDATLVRNDATHVCIARRATRSDASGARIDATHSLIATTPSRIAATHMRIAATPSRIAAAHSLIDTTPSCVAAMHLFIDATHWRIDATHSFIDAAHSRIDATHSFIDAAHSRIDATHSFTDAAHSRIDALARESTPLTRSSTQLIRSSTHLTRSSTRLTRSSAHRTPNRRNSISIRYGIVTQRPTLARIGGCAVRTRRPQSSPAFGQSSSLALHPTLQRAQAFLRPDRRSVARSVVADAGRERSIPPLPSVEGLVPAVPRQLCAQPNWRKAGSARMSLCSPCDSSQPGAAERPVHTFVTRYARCDSQSKSRRHAGFDAEHRDHDGHGQRSTRHARYAIRHFRLAAPRPLLTFAASCAGLTGRFAFVHQSNSVPLPHLEEE